MDRGRLSPAVAAILMASVLGACQTPPTGVPVEVPAPAIARSVILVIGDGVDDQQLTIARNYLLAADGAFSFETFPHRGAATVLTVLEQDPATPEYAGDSASGGTALATGGGDQSWSHRHACGHGRAG